jgi:alkylhydroperoxidase/carboxymuconolactone decarboxylase family protein YurZ
MVPNERAQKNHDELFPGHVSTLAVTDPELIEIFDNFAFDEVLSHGSLDARTRLMVQLASMIASHALREYRVMIRPALIVGVTPVEIIDFLRGLSDQDVSKQLSFNFTWDIPKPKTDNVLVARTLGGGNSAAWPRSKVVLRQQRNAGVGRGLLAHEWGTRKEKFSNAW